MAATPPAATTDTALPASTMHATPSSASITDGTMTYTYVNANDNAPDMDKHMGNTSNKRKNACNVCNTCNSMHESCNAPFRHWRIRSAYAQTVLPPPRQSPRGGSKCYCSNIKLLTKHVTI